MKTTFYLSIPQPSPNQFDTYEEALAAAKVKAENQASMKDSKPVTVVELRAVVTSKPVFHHTIEEARSR